MVGCFSPCFHLPNVTVHLLLFLPLSILTLLFIFSSHTSHISHSLSSSLRFNNPLFYSLSLAHSLSKSLSLSLSLSLQFTLHDWNVSLSLSPSSLDHPLTPVIPSYSFNHHFFLSSFPLTSLLSFSRLGSPLSPCPSLPFSPHTVPPSVQRVSTPPLQHPLAASRQEFSAATVQFPALIWSELQSKRGVYVRIVGWDTEPHW